MTVLTRLTLLLAIVSMTGCVATALEGANVAKDERTRSKNMEAAMAGDAAAQYAVGKSYCCSPNNQVHGIYDNNKATEYLCKSARQNYAAAQYMLGDIYSGKTVHGLRLLRRVANAVAGEAIDNKNIAYYWYTQAANQGDKDAKKKISGLDKLDISAFTSLVTTPCTLVEVYGESESQPK